MGGDQMSDDEIMQLVQTDEGCAQLEEKIAAASPFEPTDLIVRIVTALVEELKHSRSQHRLDCAMTGHDREYEAGNCTLCGADRSDPCDGD